MSLPLHLFELDMIGGIAYREISCQVDPDNCDYYLINTSFTSVEHLRISLMYQPVYYGNNRVYVFGTDLKQLTLVAREQFSILIADIDKHLDHLQSLKSLFSDQAAKAFSVMECAEAPATASNSEKTIPTPEPVTGNPEQPSPGKQETDATYHLYFSLHYDNSKAAAVTAIIVHNQVSKTYTQRIKLNDDNGGKENKAILLAMIHGLKQIPKAVDGAKPKVVIHTLSKSNVSLISYVPQWQKNGWMKSNGKPVNCQKLAEELYALMADKEITPVLINDEGGCAIEEQCKKTAQATQEKYRITLEQSAENK